MSRRKLHTEKELYDFDKYQTYRLSKLASSNRSLFETLGDYMPFYITLNNRKSLDTTYVSKVGQELMELGANEIVRLGYAKIVEITDKLVLSWVQKIIGQYEKSNDHDRICSYFQRMNFQGNYSWVSTFKTVFDEDQYFNVGYPIRRLGKTGKVLSETLDEVFVEKHGLDKFNKLGKREKEILMLVAKGYSSKELSEMLFLSTHTIKTHRKNISSKLGISSIIEWVKFAQAFEMIN